MQLHLAHVIAGHQGGASKVMPLILGLSRAKQPTVGNSKRRGRRSSITWCLPVSP